MATITRRRRRLLILSNIYFCRFLMLAMKAKNRYRKRRSWHRPSPNQSKTYGDFDTLKEVMRKADPGYFEKYMRMTRARFDRLATLLSPKLRKYNFGRMSLSPSHRLAVTLRFMATGESYKTISRTFHIGLSTVHKVVTETCDAIWSVLSPIYLAPPETDTWKAAAREFEDKWQFPNCCGVVDGKYVVDQQPPKNGSWQASGSIVLLAIVDASCRFLAVDIGGSRSQSDADFLESSPIGVAIDNGTMGLPEAGRLPNSDSTCPYVLVGDEPFQMTTNFMRPYARHDTDDVPKSIFNRRLNRARLCGENAFGVLSAQWRIFRRPLLLAPNNVDKVLKATVVLHNYLLTEETVDSDSACYCPSGFVDAPDADGYIDTGRWRTILDADQSSAFVAVGAMQAWNPSRRAVAVRSTFADHFVSSAGIASWQWRMPGVQRPP